jgi:hypothetical protein
MFNKKVQRTVIMFNKKVQRTVIFVAKINFPRFEGAAHRNITNITVRCTFTHDVADFSTNIAVRCTSKLIIHISATKQKQFSTT